jgi:gluconolactonase
MIFATDLGVPEGPVLLDDGSWLVVEMRPDRGCVSRISADGLRQPIARTGRPNGLAVDRGGDIWVAESAPASLLRMTPTGGITGRIDQCDGQSFLFPNDLAFGPDGLLYMTDSGIRFEDFAPGGQIRSDWRTTRCDGRVYRIDPHSGEVTKLDDDIGFANGIAFDRDGDLYVSETLRGDIYRYRLSSDPGVSHRELFGNVVASHTADELRGPDGMKFSADGDLYVTVFGQGDVTVLGPDGTVKRRLPTAGRAPTNLAFGPRGSRSVYVTETEFGTLEVLDVGEDGLLLHRGKEDPDAL